MKPAARLEVAPAVDVVDDGIFARERPLETLDRLVAEVHVVANAIYYDTGFSCRKDEAEVLETIWLQMARAVKALKAEQK